MRRNEVQNRSRVDLFALPEADPVAHARGVAGDHERGEHDVPETWVEGVGLSGSHLMKKGELRVGLQALTPSWRQRSLTPSGRCRLPCTAFAPKACLLAAMSSTR